MKKKTIALLMVMMLVFGVSVGGTVAYLMDTKTVTNTFTVGNVKIKLYETDVQGKETETGLTNLKMVPGTDIAKNPTIVVDQTSENCWIFVKVEGNESYTSYLQHTMADGWSAVDGATGVFVYAKDGSNVIAGGTTIQVLAENKVTVKTDVTQTMMDNITDNKTVAPTLSITAYAIQSANLTDANADGTVDAAEAWALVSAF